VDSARCRNDVKNPRSEIQNTLQENILSYPQKDMEKEAKIVLLKQVLRCASRKAGFRGFREILMNDNREREEETVLPRDWPVHVIAIAHGAISLFIRR